MTAVARALLACLLIGACSSSFSAEEDAAVADAAEPGDSGPRPDAGDAAPPEDAGREEDSGPVSCREVDACTREPDSDQVCIPGGWFVRGDDADPDARPAQEVYVPAFWMDVTEVSVGEFNECVAVGACAGPASPLASNLPITNIPTTAMQDFCTFRRGRLPTETEWERAARGDDGRRYPWGDEPSCDRANWVGCPGADGPTAVGAFPDGASPYGVLNLAGNAAEVTDSLYEPGGYPRLRGDAVCDPNRPTEMGRPIIVRGCSWLAPVGTTPDEAFDDCRATSRSTGSFDARIGRRGFRCAQDGA